MHRKLLLFQEPLTVFLKSAEFVCVLLFMYISQLARHVCSSLMSGNSSKVSWIMETITKKGDCILSLYASDGAIIPDYGLKNILRITPFVEPIEFISKTKVKDYREIIQFDEDEGIYYIDLGTSPENAHVGTGFWVWPESYTILMWVKWEISNLSQLTIFHQIGTAPIVVHVMRNKFCVYDSHVRTMCDKATPSKEWQFVAVRAGNNCSSFFIGDLNRKPKFIEKIDADIGGGETFRIGNEELGPGKVAMMKVFNYELDLEALESEYYCSKYEISLQWSKEEMNGIKQILMEFVLVKGIVECIVNYCCFGSY